MSLVAFIRKKFYMCLKNVGNLKGQREEGTKHPFHCLFWVKITWVSTGQGDVSLLTQRKGAAHLSFLSNCSLKYRN